MVSPGSAHPVTSPWILSPLRISASRSVASNRVFAFPPPPKACLSSGQHRWPGVVTPARSELCKHQGSIGQQSLYTTLPWECV